MYRKKIISIFGDTQHLLVLLSRFLLFVFLSQDREFEFKIKLIKTFLSASTMSLVGFTKVNISGCFSFPPTPSYD